MAETLRLETPVHLGDTQVGFKTELQTLRDQTEDQNIADGYRLLDEGGYCTPGRVAVGINNGVIQPKHLTYFFNKTTIRQGVHPLIKKAIQRKYPDYKTPSLLHKLFFRR